MGNIESTTFEKVNPFDPRANFLHPSPLQKSESPLKVNHKESSFLENQKEDSSSFSPYAKPKLPPSPLNSIQDLVLDIIDFTLRLSKIEAQSNLEKTKELADERKRLSKKGVDIFHEKNKVLSSHKTWMNRFKTLQTCGGFHAIGSGIWAARSGGTLGGLALIGAGVLQLTPFMIKQMGISSKHAPLFSLSGSTFGSILSIYLETGSPMDGLTSTTLIFLKQGVSYKQKTYQGKLEEWNGKSVEHRKNQEDNKDQMKQTISKLKESEETIHMVKAFSKQQNKKDEIMAQILQQLKM